MLGQRRGRWPNIKTALVQRLVCAGSYLMIFYETMQFKNGSLSCFLEAVFLSVGAPAAQVFITGRRYEFKAATRGGGVEYF